MSDAGSRAASAEPTQNPVEEEVERFTEEAPAGDDGSKDRDENGGDEAEKSAAADKDDALSDILSEIDEDQFRDEEDDFLDDDEDRPREIDEDALKSLKPAARKLVDGDSSKKKTKMARRPKKRSRDEDDVDVDAVESGGNERRPRKARATNEARAARKESLQEDPEENLTPEERKLRALNRVMEDAVRGTKVRRRKKDEIDLEEAADEQIASLKMRMETACVNDNQARNEGKPALQKLALLPEVTAMLSRTAIQDSVLDPETNFLQWVKYFLEPLDDGSLPAYNIQRDIFNCLTKLPITKEMLLSSEIGKVVLFYTKSRRADVGIKRIAERLVGEWSRPILKRSDDYKKRQVETRDFDYSAAKMQQRQAASGVPRAMRAQNPVQKTKLEAERERLLAPDVVRNRHRPAGLPQTYTIAPRSTFDASQSLDHKPIGAAGAEQFRKITQKGKTRR